MLQELRSFRGSYRILHLTWFAFFLTFVCWFNFAPFASIIGKDLGFTEGQIKTLLVCNLAITIPARVIIGSLLDRYGPRLTYSFLLMFAIVPCAATAFAQNFTEMVIARLLMGIVGAGFVVGIRMVAEWFPPKDIGMAQGIYGGWGNFGAFGAEFALPIIATATAFLSGGSTDWRLAIMLTGVVTAAYGFVYLKSVTDTPPGKEYKRPKQYQAMEVTSARDFVGLLVMNFGLIFALGLLAWRLAQKKIQFLNAGQMYFIWALLAMLFAYQSYQAWVVNRDVVMGRKQFAPADRYEFSQVALLQFTYIVTFGSELAAVSMLPGFFEQTFGLQHAVAAIIASTYPFLNLFSRPSGGIISDKFGSRKWTMTIVCGLVGLGYLGAHLIDKTWALPVAVAMTMFSALFAQAGCGGTYAIVPLIKKEITGQVAGNVGAYGNFGGVVFLTIFSLTDARTLFSTMGITALVCASMCAFFLKEPRNSFGLDGSLEVQGVPIPSSEFR